MKLFFFTKNIRKMPKYNIPNLEERNVIFNTSNYDDLFAIAKHRILTFPTSVLLNDKGKVLVRMRGLMPKSYVNMVVNS